MDDEGEKEPRREKVGILRGSFQPFFFFFPSAAVFDELSAIAEDFGHSCS